MSDILFMGSDLLESARKILVKKGHKLIAITAIEYVYKDNVIDHVKIQANTLYDHCSLDIIEYVRFD